MLIHAGKLHYTPETLMSLAGYNYVTQKTVISLSCVFVLHAY